jgi:hypothetical protein
MKLSRHISLASLAILASVAAGTIALSAALASTAAARCAVVIKLGKGLYSDANCMTDGGSKEYINVKTGGTYLGGVRECAEVENPMTETGEYTEENCQNKAGQLRWIEVVRLQKAEFLSALWLESGSPVSAILSTESEGELELVGNNGGGLGIKVAVLCSGILDGWIGPNGLDYTSELLTLAGTAVPSTALTGTPLACTNNANCTKPEVWADAPWESETVLMVVGTETFYVDLLFNAGWTMQCEILGTKVEELCSAAETAVKLTNEVSGTVDTEFSFAFQALAELSLDNCTSGGTETGEVNGLGILLESGVTLSVSSE